MAAIRELKSRIKSVNATKKITKAQELIATSQITKAQARVAASEPYATELTRVIGRLAAATSLDHRMLAKTPAGPRTAVLVVTSDRGMCGGYNHNVLKRAEQLFNRLRSEGRDYCVYVTGSKGASYYTFRGRELAGQWSGFSQRPAWTDTHDVRRHIVDGFRAGSESVIEHREGLNDDGAALRGFDEVYIVYTQFESMLTQSPVAHRLLPIEAVREDGEIKTGDDLLSNPEDSSVHPEYEFEPSADELLDGLLPKYVSRRIFAAMLEAAASENAARRTAMKSATDNANELVRELSREANTARQAQITQEITEIVGGAGALSESAGRD